MVTHPPPPRTVARVVLCHCPLSGSGGGGNCCCRCCCQDARTIAGSLTDVMIETQRRKHLAYLIAEQGQHLDSESSISNLTKIVRRQSQRRKSGLGSLLFGNNHSLSDPHSLSHSLVHSLSISLSL
uniref:Uncharacterized protein n=1 Tax=Callorhinchus milii TaxID=7868 RepID=A0A4W3GM67_CALMI